ncbi:hypothetical protein QTO34_000360 [Cnephaeus nilssonii]|uniref:Uncharacterized protein n=1 Tax=Cnephaeus nilssonii TaxID=3371016 RepID=A0AA40IBC2_CNENI|nr:hypothetical protein QTO34_000360 [Eptesicus nilssonii]
MRSSSPLSNLALSKEQQSHEQFAPSKEQQPCDQLTPVQGAAAVGAASPTIQRSHHSYEQHPPKEPLPTEEQLLPWPPEEQLATNPSLSSCDCSLLFPSRTGAQDIKEDCKLGFAEIAKPLY